MPNIHLTDRMKEYVQGQINSGAYANTSQVVRAGIRLLMEKDGACQLDALKANFEEAPAVAEDDEFYDFNPKTFDPDAYTS